MIRQIFWNPAQRRIRSFWRILIAGILAFVSCFLAGFVLYAVIPRDYLLLAAVSWVTMGILVLGTIGIGYVLDRRDWWTFGFRFHRRWFADLAFGLLLGFVLVSLVVLAQLVTGTAHVEWETGPALVTPQWLELPVLVVIFFSVGVYEEVAFRGYLFKNLAEGWNWRWTGPRCALLATAGFTSLLFGVVHAMNPNATAVGVLNTALVGLFLAQALMMTGQLATPIGYHITWNMTQSMVFGMPVSGLDVSAGLYPVVSIGPDWLTGGEYGIEGGLYCTAATLLGMLLIVLWARFSRGRARIDRRLAIFRPARGVRASRRRRSVENLGLENDK